jgi:two-component system nitrogen regulation response regulator GlnG
VDDLPLEIRQDTAGTSAVPALAVAIAPAAGAAVAPAASMPSASDWLALLVDEVARRLAAGERDVMDELGRQFEAAVIRTALKHTHGRRIEAASKLGVGRNTITRKIQELGLED